MTCPEPVTVNNDTGWLGREPTVDEREVATWMEQRDVPRRILHVGVGAALLTRKFGASVRQGITRDGAEAVHARTLGLQTILCNKYDVPSYREQLDSPFDCIVDVNVRSYACCDVHFRAYMEIMRQSLSPSGALLTSTLGLSYLRPTSVDELKRLCPEWAVRSYGNVVVMKPRQSKRIGAAARRIFLRS